MRLWTGFLYRNHAFQFFCNKRIVRTMAKATPNIASLGAVSKKPVLDMGTVKVDVETDAYKLVKYVCGTNYQTEDGEGVEIKPDSEYPDWLWTLPTGKAPKLDELDKNTLEYWRTVRKLGMKKRWHLISLKSRY